MGKFLGGKFLGGKFLDWAWRRARRPATWAGIAMLAVLLGVEPMQARRVARAVALIVTEEDGAGVKADEAWLAGEPGSTPEIVVDGKREGRVSR